MGQTRHFGPRRSLPVYPDKQTFSVLVGMSQRCQTRTWPYSFNDLVGAGDTRPRVG
jgi:hypothetical protein